MSKIRDYVEKRLTKSENDGYKIAEEIKAKFNTQCLYANCGGFDSPGYDIDCFAIAFINEDGVLELVDYSIESY